MKFRHAPLLWINTEIKTIVVLQVINTLDDKEASMRHNIKRIAQYSKRLKINQNLDKSSHVYPPEKVI